MSEKDHFVFLNNDKNTALANPWDIIFDIIKIIVIEFINNFVINIV